jgi:hypothetical protein
MKDTLLKLIGNIVNDQTSDDLFKLIEMLDVEDDNRQFCERYELGRWFEEAMDLNDISAITELEKIARKRLGQESDQRIEDQVIAEAQRGQY